MTMFSPREEELFSRLEWFIKLRWLFILTLAALMFFAVTVFQLKFWITPIAIIAGIVLLYNLGFYLFHWLARDRLKTVLTSRGLRLEANFQIGLDLLCLVGLIHFSGGIENPFIFFFVFHMIMGSILLYGRDIWFQAAGAITLLFTLLGLSYLGVITHHRIEGFATPDLWDNRPYIWAGAMSFAGTLMMAVYMTSSISRSVHHREEELFAAKNQLEKKSRELEKANQELIRQQNLLIQSEKLASLGKLSAGIAHELNNPLTGILNFSHFIKDSCTDLDGVQNDIKIVIRETERCKKIIKGLLDFARQNQPEKKEADVLKTLNRTVSLVQNHKDFKNIEIIKDYDQYLPAFSFDADQMQQVFMNLIVNAQEAMSGGGTIHIRAKYDAPSDQIEITFRDSGAGVSPEHLQKIFDPFYTTKEMGTGLGLSISMGIIQNHGGSLEVQSLQGEGAAFIVKLPISESRQEVWL
jgi:signal transduction histidine kinase